MVPDFNKTGTAKAFPFFFCACYNTNCISWILNWFSTIERNKSFHMDQDVSKNSTALDDLLSSSDSKNNDNSHHNKNRSQFATQQTEIKTFVNLTSIQQWEKGIYVFCLQCQRVFLPMLQLFKVTKILHLAIPRYITER